MGESWKHTHEWTYTAEFEEGELVFVGWPYELEIVFEPDEEEWDWEYQE